MKHKHVKHTGRWKVAGLSAAFLAGGIVLIILSNLVLRPVESPGADGKAVATSAPAASAPAKPAPATAPAGQGSPISDPAERRRTATQGMSGMLMLIGLLSIAFGAVCAGWVVYDIYRSRPAWKTQTKYPRRR